MLKIFKWPIIYFISIVLLLFVSSFVFTLFNDVSLLSSFIMKYQLVFTSIIGAIFIPLLIKDYNKLELKENKFNALYPIIIGIVLSIIFNTVVFYIDSYFHFTNLFDSNNRVLIALFSSCLIGPIIEELMFRGIIYNNLKKIYKPMKCILITTVVFSFLHFNLVQVVYGLIIGFMLIYIYELYKNIKAPIYLHIASNTTSLFYVILLNKNILLINISLFIISLLVLIIIQYKIKCDIIRLDKGDLYEI